jgi:hypothetical protein
MIFRCGRKCPRAWQVESRATIGSIHTSQKLFILPEYEQAFAIFVHRAIHELMCRKNPILGGMKTLPPQPLSVFRSTLPSGQVVENKPILVQSPFNFSIKDAIAGNVDGLLGTIDEAADDGLRTIMPRFFEYVGQLSDAAGTSIDAKGRPPSHELFLEMIEKIDIEFDKDDKPIMPTLVVNPEMAEVLRKLPPPTPEQEKKHQDLMSRKRQEYNDRRRHRKLS